MKKIFVAALTVAVLCSCNNNKKQEDDAFNQIMKVHESLMAQDEKLTNDKSKLDSLAKSQLAGVKDTTAEKGQIRALSSKLNAADEAMDKWMHQFEPDQSAKAHDAKMKYFDEQQKQITAVDTQINNALKAADDYLKQHPQK